MTPTTVAIAKQKKIAKRRYRTLKNNINMKTLPYIEEALELFTLV